MILTQEEINCLGDEHGLGTLMDGGEILWFDSDPTNLIRAVEKLIVEKLQLDGPK
jgi:hypothetical protein